jgi:hypothetical protein
MLAMLVIRSGLDGDDVVVDFGVEYQEVLRIEEGQSGRLLLQK